jgi:hypothetical protein
MCYNCGCGMPDDDMGQGHILFDKDGKSITDHTMKKLSEDWKISEGEVKETIFELLTGAKKDEAKEHQMAHLYEEAAASQGMTVDQARDETKKLLTRVLKK